MNKQKEVPFRGFFFVLVLSKMHKIISIKSNIIHKIIIIIPNIIAIFCTMQYI